MSYADEIDFTDDTIETSDIADRLERVTDILSELADDLQELQKRNKANREDGESVDEIGEEDIVNSIEEMETERDLLQKVIDDTDATQGNRTLIHDDHFDKRFARDEAERIGSTYNLDAWPYNCIDWNEAADNLKSDYSSVEIDGTTFYYN